MSKLQTVVKVGPLEYEYEAEVLTAITEPGAIAFANHAIREFTDNKWSYSEEKKEYQLAGLKDQRDFAMFDRAVIYFRPVLAADKNTCFETVAQLWELFRSDAAGFEKIYQAAIQANPTLEFKPVEVPKEGEPNPLD